MKLLQKISTKHAFHIPFLMHKAGALWMSLKTFITINRQDSPKKLSH